MDLIASKDFRIVGGKFVKRDERFTLEPVIADVYLRAKLATIAPPLKKAMVAEAPAPYLTRAMSAVEAAVIAPVKRPRGRPRKAKPVD